jgi:hypothetical protein
VPGNNSVSPHSSSIAAKLEDMEMRGEILHVDTGLMAPFMHYIDETDRTKPPSIKVLRKFTEPDNQVKYFNGMLMGEAPSEGAAIVPVRPVNEGYVVDHHSKTFGKENQKPDWVISYVDPVVFEHQVGAIIELKAGEGDFDSEAIYQAVGRIHWIFHCCPHRCLMYVFIINYKYLCIMKGERKSFGRVIITVEKGLENWKVLAIVRAPMPVLGCRLNDPYLTPIAHGGTASVYLSQRPHSEPLIVKFVASAGLAEMERNMYSLIQDVEHTCTLCPAWSEWGDFAVVLNEVCTPATHLTAEDVKNLAECIRELHERNILHADVRKSNIMRASNGDIMMVDFGFSKVSPFVADVYAGTLTTASDRALEAIIADALYTPCFLDDWESFIRAVLSFRLDFVSKAIHANTALPTQKDKASGLRLMWNEMALFCESIFHFVRERCDRGVISAQDVADLCALLEKIPSALLTSHWMIC